MFKKLKDKIEEVRQTPPRLPVQSLAQYSPFAYPKSAEADKDKSQLLIDLNDNRSGENTRLDEDETSNADVSSPTKSAGAFQSVDLSEASATSTPNPNPNPADTRTSSESLFQGETPIPSYTPPSYLFNPQSDMESASEYEDSSPKLDAISKSEIYEAFRKSRLRYQKYRVKYAELVKAYKEIDAEKEKIRTKLGESQDKSLRRIAELREESLLDKQAKNDLEVTYRIMLDEKDELINVLHTQVRLLKDGVTNDVLKYSANDSNESVLNSLSNAAAGDSVNQVEVSSDNEALLEKNKRLENILLKCKENMKTNKERITQLLKEKNELQLKLDDTELQLEQKNISHNNINNSEQTPDEQDVEKNEELYLLRVKIEEITREKEKLQQTLDENSRQLAEQPDLHLQIAELTAARANLEQNQHETLQLIQDLTSHKQNHQTQIDIFSQNLKTTMETLKKHQTIGPKIQQLPSDEPETFETISAALVHVIHAFQSETDALQYKLESNEKMTQQLTEVHDREMQELLRQINVFQDERESVLDNVAHYKQQVTNATLELQKHQFACNNLVHENEELQATIQDLHIQISTTDQQLGERDEEISQLAAAKMAAEETLSAQMEAKPEAKPDDEGLSLLLHKFEKEAEDRDDRLKRTLDDLEMEKVMRQSSIESEQEWIKKFEESNALVNQLQVLIGNSEEEKRHDRQLLEETSERLAQELETYRAGERRLREELEAVQARQSEDRARIVGELAKLEETVEMLSRDKEELQQKLESDKEIYRLKLSELRDKASESVGALKEKADRQEAELRELTKKESAASGKFGQEIEAYEEQIKLLQAEKEDLLGEFAGACRERDGLREEAQVLRSESIRVTEEYEKCRKLLEEMETVCKSRENEIAQMRKEKMELVEKSEEFRVEKERLVKEIDDVKRENEEKWEQRESEFGEELQVKMVELKKKAQVKLTQIKKQMQSNKDETKVEVIRLQEEILNLTLSHQTEIENVKLSADNILKDTKIELEERIMNLESQQQLAREEASIEAKAEICQLQEKISNLISSHQTELESVQSSADNVLGELKTELEERIRSLEKQLQLAREEAAVEVQTEMCQLQEKISNLVSSHQTELENVQSSADNFLKDSKTELEERIRSLEKQLQLAREEASVVQTEMCQFQEKMSNLTSSHEIELNNLQSKAENTLSAVKLQLEEKIVRLEAELESAEKWRLEESDKLNATVSRLEERVRILGEEKQMESDMSAALETKFTLETEAMKRDIEVKNAQIDESLLLAQENASEKEKLLEKNKIEMKKFAQQLKKREDEIVELRKQLDAQEPESLDQVKSVYEEKLAAKDDEQAEKIKELVRDFNIQLQSKEQEHDEMMSSTVEKLRNEKAQMEKMYQDQVKEVLGDLRERETSLENLIATLKQENEEKERMLASSSAEYKKKLSTLDHEHSQKLQDSESKSKAVLNKRLKENSQRYDEEIRGLTNEWNAERKLTISESGEQQAQKLEKQSLLTMAVIESNSGSNQLLRREVMSQSMEMASISTHHQNETERLKLEINNLQRLLESAGTAQGPLLTEPTQMEYLRNILFEYMMGRQTTTLAKVIAAVVKFTEFQTQKILEKEESRHNVN